MLPKAELQRLAQDLIEQCAPLSWEERLQMLTHYTHLNIAFSSSFSYEDQAITHVIATHNLPVRAFTLDTGRLFEETHDVISATEQKYPTLKLETYYPDAHDTQNLVAHQGINGFRDSIEKRKACCFTRKVEPLNRALEGVDIWISGLRHEHSDNRSDLPPAEIDEARGLIKFYPLIDVLEEEIKPYIQQHNIPYNTLHDNGFPSIGCAPCTRAVSEGEHPRAGRWWWESEDAQECGLHMVNGRLVRTKDLTQEEKRQYAQ